jgi:hypothetical protein
VKLVNFLFFLLVALVIGGFIWFSITDIPIEQTTITETIPYERFLENT